MVSLPNQDSRQALEEDMGFSQAAKSTGLLNYFTALLFLSYVRLCTAIS